ncbi:MFS transporter [Bifidobacterium asteroides]|uniref:MFS transporter n=1 Tax=Bifidobacterium asteroides TaxID=1684 RepID=A0A318MF31_9BIFI|nr:MFS transporter [Bifidobacterium asteroides]PXY86608.1 MFS transporter [Bifidobacterium asteroides]
MSTVAKKAWSGTVTDEEQPKPPYRVGVALALVSFLWIGPYLGVQAVLLPSKVAVIAPSSKESVIAILSTSAMIVAALANIVFGALSDLTRSRWGRRTPWIVFGSIACAVMLIVVNMANTVVLLVLAWCIYQLFLNAIVAPSIAILSDMTAPRNRGVITSIYALGYSIGLYGGQIIGAQFLNKVTAGFIVMALLTLIAGPVGALGMREQSSLDMPKSRFDMHMVIDHFSFPVHHARDYYLALCGKFLIVSANFAISGYQLYILTDYMKQDSSQTSRLVSMISLCLMVTAIVMSAVAGPIADRIQRRKLPVVIASLFIAVGAFIPFLDNHPWTMIAYGVIGGIGMGTYNAVDQALNIEVLPNPDSAAKDLGILNLANTGGQVLGPVLSATLISAFGYQAIFPASTVCALGGAILVGLIKSVK